MKWKLFALTALTSLLLQAQPSLKWTSPVLPYAAYIGWMTRGSSRELRFYVRDQVAGTLTIMSGPLSSSPSLVVNYDPITEHIYFCPDFTGDAINDIAISKYTALDPRGIGRFAFRVIDAVSGQTVFRLDDSTYSYDFFLTEQGDIDNDGRNEFAVERENMATQELQVLVYSTNGIASSIQTPSAQLPLGFHLNQNFPNPFNPSTKITFDITEGGPVQVEIFDINGKLVRSYSEHFQQSGSHEVTWDGKTEQGVQVASGAYFYRLVTKDLVSSKKMLFIK